MVTRKILFRLTSEVDQEEAFEIGKFAVKKALQVSYSFSAGIEERKVLSKPYKVSFRINLLKDVAGQTKVMSKDFYNYKQILLQKNLINYALPLIGKTLQKQNLLFNIQILFLYKN